MEPYDIDDVDAQLLSLLQKNARYTATELADRIGVSDNTIHNRMQRLEDEGVITGYTTAVDHERTGLSLYFSFICTARISNRSRVAEKAMTIPEVIEVTELMTGQQNLQIKAYGGEDEDITRVAKQLDKLELEINDENLIREERVKPLDYSDLEETQTV
ncbi:AsnC family transcriptional regulator [Halobacteria archaeon AArc-m2/3/4]|uniref:AsnC family transcriptional regulator n=1 Tax=Natronoglomus mannanivorans TaxID=2979990 RepID=A0ABT2QCD5_9EURY|nr:AsnC family transcriptional regulator [Halobacteria archaeon AArc-m2/3/4]